MDKRKVNFSQKGFSGNFLALMKKIESNELCCLDFLTRIYTEDTTTVTFTGSGTQSDPLKATSVGGGGGTITGAVNGLDVIGANIVLGGPLIQPTLISAITSSNTLTIENESQNLIPTFIVNGNVVSGGSQPVMMGINDLSGQGLGLLISSFDGINITAPNTGIFITSGVTGINSSGDTGGVFSGVSFGVNASATNGVAVTGVSQSSTGVIATTATATTTTPALMVLRTPSAVGSSVFTMAQFRSTTNSITGVNSGINVDFQPSLPGSQISNAFRILTRWTSVSSPTSETQLWGFSANAAVQTITILHIGTGRIGFGVTAPTAGLHLRAGSATASTGPLKFTSGPLLTTPETGAVEYDGTHFYGTIGATRFQLDQQATGIVGANPTASLGLTAINGVATTFMRSDASPALSQAIIPTWTGVHTFSNQGKFTFVAITGVPSVQLSSTNPQLDFELTSGALNEKRWNLSPNGSTFSIRGVTDAGTSADIGYQLTRSAQVITQHDFYTGGIIRATINSAGNSLFTGNVNSAGVLSSSANNNIAGPTNSGVTINGGSNFSYVTLFDQTQTVNNRTAELIFISGQLQLRFLNDAHSTAVIPLSITGGQAGGITSVDSNTGSGRWTNTGDLVITRTSGNSIALAGTASAGVPSISTEGANANISLQINTKGSGGIILNAASSVIGTFGVSTLAGTGSRVVVADAAGTLSATQSIISVTASLTFPSTVTGSSNDQSVTVTGAALGDTVIATAIDPTSNATGTCYTAWISGSNTVQVRFNNYSIAGPITPVAGNFRVTVFKF